jgi:hypothetical protein
LRKLATTALAAAALVGSVADARADKSRSEAKADAKVVGDGYCDHVKGVAAADSALMFSPELFASYGKQPTVTDDATAQGDDVRFIAGVSVRLSGIYEGMLTRKRAKADCRRHEALGLVEGGTTYAALQARAAVLDAAMDEATKLLTEADADLDARRATAQEVLATRLRVDALRELAAETRRQLDELPPPGDPASMAGAADAYYAADADVEEAEAGLRRARAWDVSLKFGIDDRATDDGGSPYFALIQVNFNPGWLFQGSANSRAAAGRRRLVRQERQSDEQAAMTRLRALLEIETRRMEETGVLARELEQQLEQLKRIGGENSRRLRDTIWFEVVQAKAEHAYFEAHVQSLRQILGEDAEGIEVE